MPTDGPRRWRTYDDVADLFDGTADPEWARDRDLIDQTVRNPWPDE
ncbi:hypothetical protein [Prauserella rugosa]|nr:hypothetical protein [Prauserella rugosa]